MEKPSLAETHLNHRHIVLIAEVKSTKIRIVGLALPHRVYALQLKKVERIECMRDFRRQTKQSAWAQKLCPAYKA